MRHLGVTANFLSPWHLAMCKHLGPGPQYVQMWRAGKKERSLARVKPSKGNNRGKENQKDKPEMLLSAGQAGSAPLHSSVSHEARQPKPVLALGDGGRRKTKAWEGEKTTY